MSYRFLSFGVGVQSTALLLTGIYDEIIFADTQGEHPETYEYLQAYVLPYVKEKGIKFTVLDTPVSDSKNFEATRSLEEFCLRRRMTPSRMQRWCTERFKISRIAKYIKDSGHKPATAVMGISWDEMHRMHTSHSRAYSFEYPLVDKHLTREDCRQTIIKQGWPVPPKSGCFYCPFKSLSGWKVLYQNHPELYNRARNLEESQMHYPKYTLAGKSSLARLAVRFGEGNQSLDDFAEEPCDSGYCMT